jgi:signal transduction histidine kinase
LFFEYIRPDYLAGMVSRNLLIALLSILFFGGILVWQLQHLQEMKQLRQEIFEQQAIGKLKDIALKLRTSPRWGEIGYTTAYINPDTRDIYKAEVDSLIGIYFGEEAQSIYWGLIEGEKDSLLFSNAPPDKSAHVLQSPLKTCLSCLIKISMTDHDGEMILEQSVAQTRMMSGRFAEERELKHFSIYIDHTIGAQWPDYLAFAFLVGLSGLFGLSLYLNARQKRLIEQKNEFINHLSHQFKTPLASIRLGTKMLLSSTVDYKAKEMLQRIDLEGKRLDKHIQTVLQWVRAGAQGLQLDRQPMDLAALTRESILQMEPVFVDRQAQVESCFEQGLPPVLVDEYHLILVYFNLWENALKHNRGPLVLHISILRDGNFLLVKHRDNGEGFCSKVHKKAPAYTGLGLLYVERVIKAHGGALEIHSEAAAGTTITLKLPLA